MALLGGAIADRADRRRLLLLDQDRARRALGALALLALRLACRWALYVLGEAAGWVRRPAERPALVDPLPNLVEPARLRSALALNFGLYQLTMVPRPGLGGVLIGVLGSAALHRCRELPGDGRRRGGDGAPAAAERRHPSIAGAALDRRGLRYVSGNHASWARSRSTSWL
jgi:hypothetical protein